jgi:hypothetical protein
VKNILYILIITLLASCGGQKVIVTRDSQNKYLPIESAEIIGKITKILPAGKGFDKDSPCAKYPCKAQVLVVKVLSAGVAFLPSLAPNSEVDCRFAYTLAASETIYPSNGAVLPGLAEGDSFRAQLRIVGQKETGEKLYEIAMYQKN